MRARINTWGATLAVCTAATTLFGQGGPPPANVVLDPARSETIEQWRDVTGELRALRRAEIAAEEEGKVMTLGFDEGRLVSAGDVLATLDDTRARIDVDAARADTDAKRGLVDQRKAELEDRQLDMKRLTELRSRGSASESEFDRARTALAGAEARLREAEAELAGSAAALADAQARVEDMTILAPFDGVVVVKTAEVGQWLGAGDEVCELLELGRIEARLDVPERYAHQLRDEGAVVRVRLESSGETIEQAVSAVVPDVDPLSRLMPVRVILDNSNGRLAPGMAIRGQVPTGLSGQSLTVHKDAILRDDAGEFIYFAAGPPDSMVAAVSRVRTLFAVGERVAIEARSLPPSAQIVVEGNERVFPGQPLVDVGTPRSASASEEQDETEAG